MGIEEPRQNSQKSGNIRDIIRGGRWETDGTMEEKGDNSSKKSKLSPYVSPNKTMTFSFLHRECVDIFASNIFKQVKQLVLLINLIIQGLEKDKEIATFQATPVSLAVTKEIII